MRQKKKIVIINPSGSQEMTQDIARAAREFAAGRFEVIAIAINGMREIVDYDRDIREARPDMTEVARDYETQADAFIVSCHLDPNVEYLKEVMSRPVIGTGEASLHLASVLRSRFSIVDEDERAAAYKRELARRYGVNRYCVSVRLADKRAGSLQEAYARAAVKAVKEDGAQVIVVGGEGKSEMVEDLRFQMKVPVLDGLTCALILAEGMANAEYRTGRIFMDHQRKRLD